MAKILKFPSKQDLENREILKEHEEETKTLNQYSDECVEASHFLLEVLEEFINTGEVSQNFMDMNFRDETIQESRDMFVIVNMVNAMFNRYYGIPHALHREMDRCYTKIKLLANQNEEARNELDVIFEPENSEFEFTFTPEEPEDNDTD